MQGLRLFACGVVLSTPIFTSALATTTYAETYAAVSGYPIDAHSTLSDASGATASGGLTFANGVFVNSTANAQVGTLALQTASRATVSTVANGDVRASWADSFVIVAPGHDGSQTGTFSGSVLIGGALLTQFSGTAYTTAISSITANLGLNPNTGFNSGIVALQGGGRRLNGTGFDNVLEGLEQFSLTFANVPFTFGRGIDVDLRLEATSAATSSGFDTYAAANYALTWNGIQAYDQNGVPLPSFTAISPASQFNYAAVPEPATPLLLCGGLLLLAYRGKLVQASRRGAAAHHGGRGHRSAIIDASPS